MHKLSKNDNKNVIISGMHKLQTAPITGLTLKKKMVIHSKLQHHVTNPSHDATTYMDSLPYTGGMKGIRCCSICAPEMMNQQPRLVLGYAWPHATPEQMREQQMTLKEVEEKSIDFTAERGEAAIRSCH